jgi:hypothetical protein
MMPDMSIFCPPSLIEIHSAIQGDGERVISWTKIAACPCLKGFYLPYQGISHFVKWMSVLDKNSVIAISRNFLVTKFGSEYFCLGQGK